MTATRNESIGNGCGNTTRKCPNCGKTLTYSTIGNRNLADRKGNICRSCTFSGRHPSAETRKRQSASHIGFKHTTAHRTKISGNGNPMYGVHRYDRSNPFFGKQHREEARRKMRVAACKRVLNLHRSSNGRVNNVGTGEKSYFDQLEKERGWLGNRQHFVSHLGYFVDYYEPKHNIVVEYDEPRHYRHGHLREKDRKRMEQIRAHLNCEFWRYDAYRKQLVEF